MVRKTSFRASYCLASSARAVKTDPVADPVGADDVEVVGPSAEEGASLVASSWLPVRLGRVGSALVSRRRLALVVGFGSGDVPEPGSGSAVSADISPVPGGGCEAIADAGSGKER
ncbi:hypothetical protein CLIM01_13472 [Colletotrichum limetticola]|uniref:Uncharacterized protein n=1 Tax=Colletotrichum limetticola TaxID=1209924 RepID=A0ABQ9PBE0_9PEZI|nr:hypothetical protein CLIM01_13472 [Colletotrichum limetticola]